MRARYILKKWILYGGDHKMGEILKAEGISRTYVSGQVKVRALKKCDISIEKGSFTAISSGS